MELIRRLQIWERRINLNRTTLTYDCYSFQCNGGGGVFFSIWKRSGSKLPRPWWTQTAVCIEIHTALLGRYRTSIVGPYRIWMSRSKYISDVLLGAFAGFRLSLFPRSICGSLSHAHEAWCLRTVLSRMSVLRMKLLECQPLSAEVSTSCIDKIKPPLRYFVRNLQR